MTESIMPKVNDKFESLEAFEDAAKSAAKSNGFAFARKDSNLTGRNGKSPFVILQCTKGGEWRNNWNISEETRKKKKNTRRDGCPVYIRAVVTKTTDADIMWVVTKVVLDHIHYMVESDEVAIFPQYRVMNLSQKNLVRQLHDNHAPTRVITAVNKVIDGGIICTKDIVNERARIRYALNEGSNNDSAQKLLRLFEEQDESEASYIWFLQTLRTKIYNAYNCLPDVFMSDRDQALRNASSKVFPESNKMLCYEAFKKEVEALRFTVAEEQISQSLNAVKKAAQKARVPEKIELYIQSLMKDSKMWISAYTKQFCNMGISTTGRCESSHSAFKRAIETPSDLDSVFRQIDQTMRLQHLKATMRTGSNKIAINPFIRHDPKFSELIGKISVWAINQIKRILQKMKDQKLPRSSKSSITDSEFYSAFVKAEEKFEQLPDNVAKIEFISKLRQITEMPLSEPVKLPQKVVLKGHFSNTKRELLLTEHQDAIVKKKKKMLNNTTKLKNKPIQQQRVSLKQISISCSNSKLYETNIPKFMHEYISTYSDVAEDGNCGFRVIALSIGKSEDFWPDVRKLIYNELCSQKSHYIQLFLEKEKEYNEILYATQWKSGPCNSDHWMIMPSFGYVIANTFQRPVHYFSKVISLTFLPDNIPLNRNISIAFAYIFERQHFVAVKLKPNVPVPPIIRGWEDICSEQSKRWKLLFSTRITRFIEHEKECEYLQKENLDNHITNLTVS
ncbi:6181_t:CDS:2 [Dentiscutata erythropus]|uniref:6181_t:CDS:1 n=1 Tax=Dentiscutata erythropus TaxID=1348616 RepID=A0A9N8VSU3_9GLOM|nr:6181_t:CDS:2 [Dentiscutata erythropus]